MAKFHRKAIKTKTMKDDTEEWLEKRDRERAEAARKVAQQRPPAGFARIRIPTLAEELEAVLDAHNERPMPELQPLFTAIPRPQQGLAQRSKEAAI